MKDTSDDKLGFMQSIKPKGLLKNVSAILQTIKTGLIYKTDRSAEALGEMGGDLEPLPVLPTPLWLKSRHL